jgi:hypothetical protein
MLLATTLLEHDVESGDQNQYFKHQFLAVLKK